MGRTAHRRLFLHQGAVRSAKALVTEAHASERAWAKKVRCEHAAWLRTQLDDRLSSDVDLAVLPNQAKARAKLGRGTSSCPTTSAVRGMVQAWTSTWSACATSRQTSRAAQ